MLYSLILILNCLVSQSWAEQTAKPQTPQIESGHETTARDGSCLQPQVVEDYSHSSNVAKMTQKPPHLKGPKDSLASVIKALESSGIIKDEQSVIYASEQSSRMDNAGSQAERKHTIKEFTRPESLDDVDFWLKEQNFVNLKDCAYWAVRLDKATDIPKGALVLYRKRGGGPVSAIEISTPSGFWSDKPREHKTFRDPKNLEVIGVYVLPEL